MGLLLASRVAILLLRELGIPSLHTSAVVTNHGALAFLGTHGQGKSTMAAAFLRRGASLLADDVLPLRSVGGEVHGGPSIPLMKLWIDSVKSTLELHEDLPNLSDFIEKKLLALDGQYPFSRRSVALRALYLLDRYDPIARGRHDVTLRPMSGQERLAALMEHTSDRGLLRPADMAKMLPLYSRLGSQARVYQLDYPDGYEYQDDACSAIVANLEHS
jgi:hypothetical protein